eukprot:GFKZ01007603.1.p1 GENE.GFKZ01007603.1~~GFKZ01007603.1.p1  ORF type:complete len:1125 (+),score=243.92 GFKZ01007603.1:225-3599(+)
MHAFILPPSTLTSPSSISTFHPSHTPIFPQPLRLPLRLHAKLQPPSNRSPPSTSSPKPRASLPPILILLAETAIQLSIAAFAIFASLLARTRFLAFASAFFAVPQVLWSIRRYLNHRSRLAAVAGESDGFEQLPHAVATKTPDLHTLVTGQAQSLRYAMDQVERSAVEREDRRNASIAHTLSSLHSAMRDLHQVVETRNRVDAVAPVPLVAEVEVLRGKLREVEREKSELEEKLGMAEVNLEEAKRGGERASDELEEALRREVELREQVEALSVRGARLDDVLEQLERTERRNDELRQKILGGVREREEWKGRAGDAERKARRVQNLLRMLKERFGIRDEDPEERKRSEEDELDAQGRERRSFEPGSLLYEELLGEDEKRVLSESPEWPDGALQGGNSDKERQARLQGLPPDGGFGATSENPSKDGRGQLQGVDENTPQLPGTGVDNVFSFSRGEFEGSVQENGEVDLRKSDDRAVDLTDEDSTSEGGVDSSAESDGWASVVDSSQRLSTEFEGGREESPSGNEFADPARHDSSILSDSSKPDSWQRQGTASETGPHEIEEGSADETLSRGRDPQWFKEESGSNAVRNKAISERGNSNSVDELEEKGQSSGVSSSNFGSDSDNVIRGNTWGEITAPLTTAPGDIGPKLSNENSEKKGMDSSATDSGGAMLTIGMESSDSGCSPNGGIVSSKDGAGTDEISLKPFSTSEFLQSREQCTEGVSEDSLKTPADVDVDASQNFVGGASNNSSFAAANLKEKKHIPVPSAGEASSAPENPQHSMHAASGPESAVDRYPNAPLQDKALDQKNVEDEDTSDVPLSPTAVLGVNDLSSDGFRYGNCTNIEQDKAGSRFSNIGEEKVYKAVKVTLEEQEQNQESKTAAKSETVVTGPEWQADKAKSSVGTDSTGSTEIGWSSDDQRKLSSSELRASASELVRKARRRGLAVSQSGRLFQSAVSKLEAAMELEEERWLTEGQLGATLVSWAKTNIGDGKARGMLERALELLSRSMEAGEEDEGVICSLGLCLCLLGSTSEAGKARGYYERACELYDGLLERNEESRVGYFNCGLAYISLGRLGKSTQESESECREWLEKAEARFQRAAEMDPDDVKAQMYVEDCRREIAEFEAV